MIIYNPENTIGLIMHYKGSVLPRAMPYITAVTALTFFLWVLRGAGISFGVKNDAHGYLGTLLSFLLVGRLQKSCAEFWAARKQLSVAARSCVDLWQAILLDAEESGRSTAANAEWRKNARRLISASMKALTFNMNDTMLSSTGSRVLDREIFVDRLRGGLQPLLTDAEIAQVERARHPTLQTLFLLRRHFALRRVRMLGGIDVESRLANLSTTWHKMDTHITALEPFPLAQMSRVFLFVFVFSLPFTLIDDLGVYAVLAMPLLAYGYIGLDLITTEISNPFGREKNDLDVERIYEDVRATLGQFSLCSGHCAPSAAGPGGSSCGGGLSPASPKRVEKQPLLHSV
jgi:putative membrane protein